MNIFSVVLISLGLAMDAFAVSLTMGMKINNSGERNKVAIKCGLFFGVFQGIMPFIGWALGKNFTRYISLIDHWIAFIVLAIIGINMIVEAFKKEEDKETANNNKQFLFLAIATSIDALAVGVSLAFLNVNILVPVFIIGLITCILSFIGVFLGRKFGDILKNKAAIIGGIILIIIGTKILVEHLNLL